jgi:hypothetical protein
VAARLEQDATADAAATAGWTHSSMTRSCSLTQRPSRRARRSVKFRVVSRNRIKS